MTVPDYSCFREAAPASRTRPFFILGPCVIESPELLDTVAREVVRLRDKLGVAMVFKASYDKANRTSLTSFRGPGMDEGLRQLSRIRATYGLPVVTDIHETVHVERVRDHVDILQIPAFLCRQTDLLVAAARSGLPVNVKKGQFMAPEAMANVMAKLRASGNDQLLVTERGTSFGHGDLVVDFRGFAAMRAVCPLVFDATHSVQRPPTGGTTTGGSRSQVRVLARAAAAVGVNGFFMETHPDPDRALSDGPNMIHLADLESCLREILSIAAQVSA
jgi:2-dehydro-3-deoxyphosphooctonate aldolase (KDO 8-P synthase)